MGIISHYRQLWFFLRHRFEGDNYRRMSEYFAHLVLDEIERFTPLTGRKLLDVGGANGEFCGIFESKRDCWTVNLDPAPTGQLWPRSVLGLGDQLPFADESFDVVVCRGVIEHVPPSVQQGFCTEFFRVLRTGGIAYIMTQPWWNPHAGHQLRPFHVLPFPVAKFLREKIVGNKIYGNSYADARLFPITYRRMLRMIRESKLRYLCGLDTHLRLPLTTKIPLIREIAVPSVAFICRKD